jgi:hypothetical protein
LGKVGLKWINNFQYNVGDCLFDVITYLSKDSISFKMIWKNNMTHLKQSLRLGTCKVLEYHRWELIFEFLHDLHHGNANEETYILKMSISSIDGGFWGDFTTIYWIYEYLHHSIYVWNRNNG